MEEETRREKEGRMSEKEVIGREELEEKMTKKEKTGEMERIDKGKEMLKHKP